MSSISDPGAPSNGTVAVRLSVVVWPVHSTLTIALPRLSQSPIMLTFPGAVRTQTIIGWVIVTSPNVASHITKLLLSFRGILQFRFRKHPHGRTPSPCKVVKQSLFRQRAMTIHPPPKRLHVSKQPRQH